MCFLQLTTCKQTSKNESQTEAGTLPVLSELQRMVSFSCAPGPCLIHTEMVKGSFRLVLTMPSGTLMAWVPLNSNTWSLSCPLSVGSPTVQLAELLGAGRSSMVPELAPKKKKQSVKEIKVNYTENIYWKGSDLMHSWQYPFSVEQLLTAQLVQRFLRVSVTIAALSNMVGFQFNIGSDGCDWLITGLQVHAWEKGQTTCARFVFNPLIETWKTKRERREKNEKMSFSTAQITHEQSMQRLSIVIMH